MIASTHGRNDPWAIRQCHRGPRRPMRDVRPVPAALSDLCPGPPRVGVATWPHRAGPPVRPRGAASHGRRGRPPRSLPRLPVLPGGLPFRGPLRGHPAADPGPAGAVAAAARPMAALADPSRDAAPTGRAQRFRARRELAAVAGTLAAGHFTTAPAGPGGASHAQTTGQIGPGDRESPLTRRADPVPGLRRQRFRP